MVNLKEFNVSHYPDGHKHIVSNKDLHGDTELSASVKSFDDLFLIAQIKRIHPELTGLKLNYLIGGRCDRRFSPGEAIDIEIVAEYINSLKFNYVAIVQPHSKKTLELVKNSSPINYNNQLLRECLNKITDDINFWARKICYVIPDKGASNWVEKEVSKIIYNPLFLECDKVRVGDKIEIGGFQHTPKSIKYFVILDDLCDGGGTFIEIAKKIKGQVNDAKIYLVVTHAIFSKGIDVFKGWIDRIYCTNSFSTLPPEPLVNQIEI